MHVLNVLFVRLGTPGFFSSFLTSEIFIVLVPPPPPPPPIRCGVYSLLLKWGIYVFNLITFCINLSVVLISASFSYHFSIFRVGWIPYRQAKSV